MGDVWYEMWKSVHCLALELHEDIHKDVVARWREVLKERDRLEAEKAELKGALGQTVEYLEFTLRNGVGTGEGHLLIERVRKLLKED